MPFRPPILSFANVPLIESFVKGPSVLHIGKYYPPHRGGMETHLRDLAVRQTETARVNVVVSNSAPWQEYSVMDGVSVTRVARLGTIASMPVCPGLMAAIRRSPADLVHIHMPNPGAALAFLMSGHPGKLIITHHADTLGRRTLRRLSDPFVIRLMQRASRILVTSSRYLNSSEELAPFQDKCRIVPLGIDLRARRTRIAAQSNNCAVSLEIESSWRLAGSFPTKVSTSSFAP